MVVERDLVEVNESWESLDPHDTSGRTDRNHPFAVVTFRIVVDVRFHVFFGR